MPASALSALRDLGFSDLEARAYLALLQHGPASGYALAKLLARANSNTYTALEALERAGAVVCGEGSPRLYRAVPPDELMTARTRGFERLQERARRELAALSPSADEEGAFRLQSPDQAFACARGMLARARRSALADAFPRALAELGDDLTAAARRGVAVTVKAYAPAGLEASFVVQTPNGADIVASYGGATWLNLCADGREALVCLFEPEFAAVRQALWIKSRYVAWSFHCGLASEAVLAALFEAAERDPQAPLERALGGARELLHHQARAYMDAEFKGVSE
ncbi:MAG TPA: helix-turn-helix domain-containing protein [Verrucomicrobiae bacterium]|nr:helix-turn-helix domain-containing protein [Verrucomicrobiae bacterium]